MAFETSHKKMGALNIQYIEYAVNQHRAKISFEMNQTEKGAYIIVELKIKQYDTWQFCS